MPREKIESLYGYNYNYSSDSNDEKKYITRRNKRFYLLKTKDKKKHILQLWKTAFSSAVGCGVVISQFAAIQTKVSYFGRQMISTDNVSLRYEMLMNRFNNPKWFKLIFPESKFKSMWDMLMLVLVFYTAMYAPYRTAFMSYNSSDTLFFFECMCDFLLLLDIVISLMTPYERTDGSLECNFRKIRTNYILGSLTMDLVAIIPT